MFLFHMHDLLTGDQKKAWTNLLGVLSELPAENGDGQGWLFHGTDQIAATYVMNEGFRSIVNPSSDFCYGYFGDLATAQSFADKRMTADSPPAILAIRTADLLPHGIETDPNYDENAPSDWKAYLEVGGTIRVRGNGPIKGLLQFGIAQLLLHPSAAHDRASRPTNPLLSKPPHPLESEGIRQLHMAPEGRHDLTPEKIERLMSEMPRWPSDIVFTHEAWRKAAFEWIDSQGLEPDSTVLRM